MIELISEKELLRQEKRWEKEKSILSRKKKIRDEKIEFHRSYLPKISMSKILMILLFLDCTAIELFTGYITLRSFELSMYTGNSPDLTPLVTLIGAVISEVIGYAVYSLKSAKENTKGGIVFESTMKALEEDMCCSSNENNDQQVFG